MRIFTWTWLGLLGCRHAPPGPSTAPTASTGETGAATETVLTVSSYRGGRVHLFDPRTGEALGAVDGVDGAQTVVAAPSGEWVACAELRNEIVRIDPQTLEELGVLVGGDAGGLRNPDAAVFGPDGRPHARLLFETHRVPGATAPIRSRRRRRHRRRPDGPDIGLHFDADGTLLVPSWYTDRLLRRRHGRAARRGPRPRRRPRQPRRRGWRTGRCS
ncbi:MAG: hypothetical protein R3F59_00645 [Myxococcota bacterium]